MSSDLDRILASEVLALAKDEEIERVLNCCEQDHFAIFELNPLVELKSIDVNVKKLYRKKTLLLHPDKTQNIQAPKAFDRLKKSEMILSQVIPESNDVNNLDEDTSKRINEKQNLINIYKGVLDELMKPIVDYFYDETNQLIREKVAVILNEQIKDKEVEMKFQQRQEANKREELKKIQKERELKKQMASKWEDERDIRVNNWRNYSNKVEKKKKKKPLSKTKKKLLA